jgi:predicted transcriptional regulator
MKEFYDTLSVNINPEQIAWIDEYAARTHQTRSIVTRQAIAQMQLKDQTSRRRASMVDSQLVE